MLKVLQTQEDQMLEYPFKLIKALAFIHKKLNLSQDEFKHYYEKNHAPLANSLLTLESYERNYIHNYQAPFFESHGSISIFKYKSSKSLEVIGEQMASDAGDILRNDELNFMNVEKNFYLLTESNELSNKTFKKKIFYIAYTPDELFCLDGINGIIKISDNLILDHESIIGVPEYGVLKSAVAEDLDQLLKEYPKTIMTS